MYKSGVLGDRDSVYGFGALGLEVFPVEEPEAGAKLLRRLAEEGYAVLYVTEALCAQIPDELERPDEDETARRLVAQRFKGGGDARKIARFLQYRGFSPSVIRNVVDDFYS